VSSIWTKVATGWTTVENAAPVASWTAGVPLVSEIVTVVAHLVVAGEMPLRAVLSDLISNAGPTCLT
jgi:hypothetical protein